MLLIIIIFIIIIIIIISIIITMFISAVLVREEAAPLTPTVAVISPVRTALVVNLLQLKVEAQRRRSQDYLDKYKIMNFHMNVFKAGLSG